MTTEKKLTVPAFSIVGMLQPAIVGDPGRKGVKRPLHNGRDDQGSNSETTYA